MLHGEYASSFTGFYKYAFPPLWIGVFGWGTLQLFMNPQSVTFNGVKGGAPPGIEWLFLALWLSGTTFILWIAWRLAWVRVADGRLYIRRFSREVQIDPRWLRSVSEVANLRPRAIRIKFMNENGRDEIVWLMPTFEWPSGTPAEPHLLGELQEMIKQSRTSAA
jgi:hypothetical protein